MIFTDRFNNTINKINRTLKIDTNYLLRGGISLGSIEVVGAILGLILTISFANLISPDTYGTYKYILSIYSFFVLATIPGVDTALTRSISQGNDGDYKLGINTKLRWGILGVGLMIIIGTYNYLQGHLVVGMALIIISSILPLFETAYLYTSVLNGKKLFRLWAKMENISNIFSTLAILFTITQTNNVFLIVGSYFLPYLIIRTIYTVWTYKNIIISNQTSHDFISYSKSLTVFQITTRAANVIDQIALFHLLGPAQLAMFSIAYAIPSRIQSIFRVTGTLATPKFSTKNYEATVKSLPIKMFYFSLIILIVISTYIISAPLIFKIFFPKYITSLSYSQILIFYTLSAITYPVSSLFFAHKKIAQNYIISLSGLIVKIATLLIAIPLWGIWGAVLSIILHSITVSVLSLCFIIGKTKKLNFL